MNEEVELREIRMGMWRSQSIVLYLVKHADKQYYSKTIASIKNHITINDQNGNATIETTLSAYLQLNLPNAQWLPSPVVSALRRFLLGCMLYTIKSIRGHFLRWMKTRLIARCVLNQLRRIRQLNWNSVSMVSFV